MEVRRHVEGAVLVVSGKEVFWLCVFIYIYQEGGGAN